MGGLTLTAVVGACQGCGACLLTCPEHAIRPQRHADRDHGDRASDGSRGDLGSPAILIVRRDLCTGCGDCVEVCPVDAIDLEHLG